MKENELLEISDETSVLLLGIESIALRNTRFCRSFNSVHRRPAHHNIPTALKHCSCNTTELENCPGFYNSSSPDQHPGDFQVSTCADGVSGGPCNIEK